MDPREQIIHRLLGKTVHVVVDRPIGYLHGDILYPVNYGYIPGVTAGDGEEQDAYILDVDVPLSEFDGRVIGAIRRDNDCEDKLIVAPEGVLLHQGQIAEAVFFVEQFFVSTVDSLLRKSCGVVPFRQQGQDREYLILRQSNGKWSFPKGHMERGETETQTALRELQEETGLSTDLIPYKRCMAEYAISPLVKKQLVLFLGQVHGEMHIQSKEITDFRWVSPAELKEYLSPDTIDAIQQIL